MEKQSEQPPLIVNTPSGEKSNPSVVTIVASDSIRQQMEQEKPKIAASREESLRIEEKAIERRRQHSA